MSAIFHGSKTNLFTYQGGVLVDPVPTLNEFITIQNVVNGKVLAFGTDSVQACSIITMKYDGVDMIDPVSNHGRGIQYAWNALPTGEVVSTNVYSPTQQGSGRNGASQFKGTSKSLYRAPSLDGTSLTTVSLAAFWMEPNQVTVPLHPALNKALVSGFLTTVKNVVGYDGNPNITAFLTDCLVPDDAYIRTVASILDMVSCSYYAIATLFPVIECVNVVTGATRAYPGFPTKLTNETIMISSNDGSLAMATHQPLVEWGPTGYAQQLTTAGLQNAFVRARIDNSPGFLTPGYQFYNAGLGFGTRAQVINAILQIESWGARTTPIPIPNLS